MSEVQRAQKRADRFLRAEEIDGDLFPEDESDTDDDPDDDTDEDLDDDDADDPEAADLDGL